MDTGNHSMVTDFILMGLTDQPELQFPLFLLFLQIYIISTVGNVGLLLLIRISSQLHTPMYYFLSNLSFIDLCYSSVITPKMLVSFLSEKNIISYSGCLAQFFFFCTFGIADCYMLTAMAYDRYVAICSPLIYNHSMSQNFCFLLVAGVYGMGVFGAITHTSGLARLSFCGNNVISHYFCDISPLLKLCCSSTYINELLVMLVVVINSFITTLPILISYGFILSSILRIHSAKGRSKAFSTCGSHLASVAVLYGSIIFMYCQPASTSNITQQKVSSVIYTTVIPMLNPWIYSLRNKDVKDALKKIRKDWRVSWFKWHN
ncbi:putative olfactory receptor 8G3 pseudogene [Trichosurus vulpecula]|uniref:putative olfactory receptor 8G3 pseudogene n=1 Tax=Trichosurus vulpecula TaxID=9337 RepID=UPI00186AFAEE|nr:putative olfactory receptor 8G3 pseudogene [Trichosurus vulpecula]